MNCSNCNAKLSCGCQQRRASNGASVCSTCLGAYEANLAAQNPNTPHNAPNKPEYIWNIPNNYYPKK